MSLYFILNDNLDINLSTPKNSQMQFNIHLKLTFDSAVTSYHNDR